MKHMVLGRGNLGHDLALELKENALFPLWRYHGKSSIDSLRTFCRTPDVIWCAIGSGSVDEAKRDFRATLERNVHLPLELCDAFPDSKIVFFSSDYVTDCFRPLTSLYAYSKRWLEEVIAFRDEPERLAVVTVGSLYGAHLPERTLPGKLRARYPEPCKLKLPQNVVTPTPTAWLAKTLANRMDYLFDNSLYGSIRVHPEGGVTVAQWGREILGPDYDVETGELDYDRPTGPGDCSSEILGPHWLKLWKEHAI